MVDDTVRALGEAGVLAPGRWRWARAIGWMAVMLVAMMPILSAQRLAATWIDGPHWVLVGIALASLVGVYAAYYALVRFGERRRVSELAPGALPRDLALGLLIGLGMFTLVFASLRLAGVYTLAPGQWGDWGHDVRAAIATGLVEELLIRLIVFRLLMRAFGMWPALIGSALLFGAAHLMNPNASYVAAAAIAVEAGLMLAAVYLLTGVLLGLLVLGASHANEKSIPDSLVVAAADAGPADARCPAVRWRGPYRPGAAVSGCA